MSLHAGALICLLAVCLAAAAPSSNDDIPQEVYYKLTGINDVQKAVESMKTETGLNSADDVDQFLKLTRGGNSWRETYDLLTSLFASTDIKLFIQALKTLLKNEDFKSSCERLVAESGQTSLVTILDTVFTQCNSKDPAVVRDQFDSVFKLPIDKTFERINELTGNKDALDFFSLVLNVTLKDNIVDAFADVRSLTTQDLDTLDFVEQLQHVTKNNATDVFKAVLSVMNEKSLRVGWQKHAEATGEPGKFSNRRRVLVSAELETPQTRLICNALLPVTRAITTDINILMHSLRVSKYTDASLLTYANALMEATDGHTLKDTCLSLLQLTDTNSYFPAIDKIYSIVNIDMTDFFNLIGSLSSKFNEVISYLKTSSNQPTFLKALEFFADKGFEQAMKNIKQDPKYYTKTGSTS